MRVLITGGCGFIGSHTAKHCLQMGYDVTVLDDLSGGYLDNLPVGAKLIKGSITDNELVKYIFSRDEYDYVYHEAAYAAEGLSHFIRRFNYTNNLLGSINLINESIRNNVKCFAFTSSMSIYGSNPTPFREDMELKPEDPYAVSKYAVEKDILAAHEMFGLNYVIFRPHNVYGENQNTADRFRNVIGIFMRQIMENKPMTIFGDGTQTRAFSYIDDVAPYIAQAPTNPKAINEIINIGGDVPYTIGFLADSVAKAFGVEANIKYLPERFEVYKAFSDHTKAYNIFDIKSNTPLDAGLKRMANWVKQVGIREQKIFSDIELTQNMPEYWLNMIK